MIIKVVGNRGEAEDVLQESFIKLWKSNKNYNQHIGRLFKCMLQITRNTAIDFMRTGAVHLEKKSNQLESNFSHMDQKNVTFTPTDHLGLSNVVDGLRDEDK